MENMYINIFTTIFMALSRYLDEPGLIRLIIYKFNGIENTKLKGCFNEFKNLEILNKNGNKLPIDYNYIIECSKKFIESNEFSTSKKAKQLILKRIFEYRSNNNMNNKIFTIRFQYKNRERIINKSFSILKPRKFYLTTRTIPTPLITKFILYPDDIHIWFSTSYLQREINKELGINIKSSVFLNKDDLIKIYLKS